MFFTFLKLLIWYQIAQNFSFGSHSGIVNFLILCGCPLTAAENILYISYCYTTGKCICIFSYLPNEQPVNIPLYEWFYSHRSSSQNKLQEISWNSPEKILIEVHFSKTLKPGTFLIKHLTTDFFWEFTEILGGRINKHRNKVT